MKTKIIKGKAKVDREQCCGDLVLLEVSDKVFKELSEYTRLVITSDKDAEGLQFESLRRK